jgi:ankyrin repeat protein
MIEMFLDHGADPYSRNADGRNAFQMAAYHGRADILSALEQRGFAPNFEGPTPDLDQLVAACAQADLTRARTLTAANPDLQLRLLQIGGALLARFAGVGNLEGLRTLLDLGIPPDALWPEGDPYFEMTRNSTALQNAAWRARHEIVRELIARGADVNATGLRGRTPLQLAVQACIDSYWKSRRQPDSVAALLAAGATTRGIALPTGYDAIDQLLLKGDVLPHSSPPLA